MSRSSTVDSEIYRCPKCNTLLPEEYRNERVVPCYQCGEQEFHSGVIVTPIAGKPDKVTDPSLPRVHSPFWKARLPPPPPPGTPQAGGPEQKSAGAADARKPTPPTQQQNLPKADGPEGGRWLWWKGKRYDIPTGNVYRLLEFMWNRDSASYDALSGPVFDSPVEPGTIRSYANKAHNALKAAGVPWRLKTDSVNRYLTKITET
jgi:hypothetical protein